VSKVNGLLYAALVAGLTVEWSWLVAARPGEVESLLIQRWHPAWDIALRSF